MRNAFILSVLCTIGAVIVGNSDLDMMNVGFGFIFLLSFFALAAFLTGLIYISRAKEFERLVNQIRPLAHWTYKKEEWDIFVDEDKKENLVVNRATLKWVLSITIVTGVLLLLIFRDVIMLWVISGIMLMVTIAAFGAPAARSAILRKGIPESFIGEHSVYVGGTFQTWNQLGAHLIAADIYKDAPIPVLHIIFEFPTLQYSQEEIIRVPVPNGKMDEANKIVDILKKQIQHQE